MSTGFASIFILLFNVLFFVFFGVFFNKIIKTLKTESSKNNTKNSSNTVKTIYNSSSSTKKSNNPRNKNKNKNSYNNTINNSTSQNMIDCSGSEINKNNQYENQELKSDVDLKLKNSSNEKDAYEIINRDDMIDRDSIKSDLVKYIIFSEILDKPKCLK